MLVLVFHGTPIEAWVPIFLFATLFGLSMDYEVFLVSRMREAQRGTGDHGRHCIRARADRRCNQCSGPRDGRLLQRISGRECSGLQQLGVGLVCAVLIDATVVRGLLVPAIMAMLGRWNWWVPSGGCESGR